MDKDKVIDFKSISIMKNIVSILLYLITTLIWANSKSANGVLKIIAFVGLGLYVLLFFILLVFSGENFGKNLKKYKKLMKNLKTTLKLLNLIILTITTISVFGSSVKNYFTIAINIFLIAINVISFLLKLVFYILKVGFRKLFRRKKNKNNNQSFLGFVFSDNLEKDDQVEKDEQVEKDIPQETNINK